MSKHTLKKRLPGGREWTRVLSISFIISFFTTLPLSHSGSPKTYIAKVETINNGEIVDRNMYSQKSARQPRFKSFTVTQNNMPNLWLAHTTKAFGLTKQLIQH
jgi:hypothetical protein